MKGSYYSNLNTSKLSTKHIEDTCLEHDGEPFTNFCSSMTCIKPLCPECIENHYNHHKNIRTAPEIDSFKTLKNKCLSKIGDILQQVGGQQSENSINQLQNIFESSLRRIREVRDHCKKIADSYFNNLEEFVKKKMGKLTSEQSELILEMDRVNNIIGELKLLLNKLDNNKVFLQSAQTIVKLDGDKILEKVKEGIQNIGKFKEMHKNNLYIEKNYEHKYSNFLSNHFYYGNKENLEMMPKIADQIKSKNTMENISRERQQFKTNRQENDFLDNSKLSKQDSKNIYNIPPNHSTKSVKKQKEDDQKSNYSRKSSKSKFKAAKKQIIGMNTFSNNSARRYLHFFQHDQSKLHYLDLQEGTEFQEIPLSLNFKLPDYHKSISVSNGDLYLLGGSDQNGRKCQGIYKMDFQNNSLALCNKLKHGRSSHSICFNNKYIYVLGGFLNNQLPTNRCERYDIVNNKVQEIRPMLYEACSFACCSFSGRYIYKFGGFGQNNTILHNIQRFDQKTNQWEEVNPILQLSKNEHLVPLSTSAAVQITKQEIMIIGGYDQNDDGFKQTYILRVEDDGSTIIRDLNTYPLPVGQGFWSNIPIIHKKMVFALQNVCTSINDCSGSVRRILSFDGSSWKELQ